MYTRRQAQILTAVTQGLDLPADTASEIRVVQAPTYIDSVIETHDFAAALMGAIGQAVATVGERRGQARRFDSRRGSGQSRDLHLAAKSGGRVHQESRTRSERSIKCLNSSVETF
jgi:hypothetical protein